MAPLVIAHRTCPRDAPENSLAGIHRAIELGADVVEVDVRRSADGCPMLLHDRWLLRTTRWPLRLEWVPQRRARKMALKSSDQHVPSLAEGLEALGESLRIAIDVKDAGAADAVIDEVRNQGVSDRTLFWSQHEEAVRTAVTMAPEMEISLLRDTQSTVELERFLADAVTFGARGVSAHWSQVSSRLAERCRADGLALYVWCKTESIEPDKLALLAGVVTDWPAAARRAVMGSEPN